MATITPLKTPTSRIISSSFTNSNLSLIHLRKPHQRFQSEIRSKSIKWDSSNSIQGRDLVKKQRGVIGCTAGEIGRELFVEEKKEEAKSGFVISERMKVVCLLACVMSLCNADRVVMSVAIVPLAAQYGWSSSFLGIVQSSFLWGYLLSSPFAGGLADKYGGKKAMAWGVAIWSFATLLTPWAADHSTAMLLAVRVIFGLAEGVALPSMNTLLSNWHPMQERSSAVGISMGGFHIGNVMGFILTPVIISKIGINGPFVLFSALGYLWLTIWAFTVTSNPRESSVISAAELRHIESGKPNAPSKNVNIPTLRQLLSKVPTWACIVANITNNWGYFILLSWMPVYFQTVFGVNLKQAAWFSALPWGMMAFSGYVAGIVSDAMFKAGYSTTSVRKIMQSIGFSGPGVALLSLNYVKTPTVAAMIFTAGLSLSSFSQAGFLMNMQDIAPQCAGFLHGITNAAGTFAAIISTIGTGYLVEWLGSFQAVLTFTGILYLATVVFWNIFATGERVFH